MPDARSIAKDSARAQMLEGSGNLMRMLQEIPLNDDENGPWMRGLSALEALCAKLGDVPASDGTFRNQLMQLSPVATKRS